VTAFPLWRVKVPESSTVKGAVVPLNAEKTIGVSGAITSPFVELVTILPVALDPLALSIWPLASVNSVVSAVGSKNPPPPISITGELAMEPDPSRARVPSFIVVFPVYVLTPDRVMAPVLPGIRASAMPAPGSPNITPPRI